MLTRAVLMTPSFQRLEMTTSAGVTDLFSPMEVAAMEGQLDAVIALVRYGKAKIEPKCRDDRVDTPLTKQEKAGESIHCFHRQSAREH